MSARRLLIALVVGLYASPVLAAPSAPGFTLKLLDGSGTFDSRALIGRNVVVVRFQASWCKLCVEEGPVIERIWEKYQPRGVQVVSVQVQDTAADAQRFLR